MYTKETARERLEDLFDALVPGEGNADTAAGEIVRAINRVGYRWYNDGDRIGHGYGKWTCNPAARFLIAKCDDSVGDAIVGCSNAITEDHYDAAMVTLLIAVCEFLDAHPELRETPNEEDMFSYRNPDEDVDDCDEDEDDWFC